MDTENEIRESFFEYAKEAGLSLEKIDYSPGVKVYECDTRGAFCDYIDGLARDGVIGEELAANVTL